MNIQNFNCDGSGPHRAGQVRLLPTGGGGNAILCRECFKREMVYREERNLTGGEFAIPTWQALKVYGS